MEQLERMLYEILGFAEKLEAVEWEETDKIFCHWFSARPIITDYRRVGKLLHCIFG